ncbi:MAG: DUF421 domain-containing protein [Candidatus Eisenbacteria bacterium]|nr:DUF421 domain-containing protein [Candidatus Eisenbacteria bacterium]
MRLTGRRQLGQMTPFDLVLILLISNAVQNAMVGPETSVLAGLVAAGTLLALNYGTGMLTRNHRTIRRVLEGEPVVLVMNGKFIPANMAEAELTEELVLQAIREHGFESIGKVHTAILEIDGTISVLPSEDHYLRRTRRRVRAIRPGGN